MNKKYAQWCEEIGEILLNKKIFQSTKTPPSGWYFTSEEENTSYFYMVNRNGFASHIVWLNQDQNSIRVLKNEEYSYGSRYKMVYSQKLNIHNSIVKFISFIDDYLKLPSRKGEGKVIEDIINFLSETLINKTIYFVSTDKKTCEVKDSALSISVDYKKYNFNQVKIPSTSNISFLGDKFYFKSTKGKNLLILNFKAGSTFNDFIESFNRVYSLDKEIITKRYEEKVKVAKDKLNNFINQIIKDFE